VPGVAIGPLVGAEAVLMLTNEPVPEAPLKGAVSWPMLINGMELTPVATGVPAVAPFAFTGVFTSTNEPVPEAPLIGAESWPTLISGRDVSPLPVVPTVLASAFTGVFTSTNEPPALELVPWPTTTSSGDVAVVSVAGVPVTASPLIGAVTVTSGLVPVEGSDEPDPWSTVIAIGRVDVIEPVDVPVLLASMGAVMLTSDPVSVPVVPVPVVPVGRPHV